MRNVSSILMLLVEVELILNTAAGEIYLQCFNTLNQMNMRFVCGKWLLHTYYEE